jgi:hypothetical protein
MFPFFPDRKDSNSYILDLPGKGERMEIFRLTKFFSEDDLLHVLVKIGKLICADNEPAFARI